MLAKIFSFKIKSYGIERTERLTKKSPMQDWMYVYEKLIDSPNVQFIVWYHRFIFKPSYHYHYSGKTDFFTEDIQTKNGLIHNEGYLRN